ncbi:MAG: NFACT family protein [Armatimonadetes bacterium]|nr:NFACT family protein [Armatimonadota bacterium]
MAREPRPTFDSLTLAAVTAELQVLVGARVQKVVQPNETTIVIETYDSGSKRNLLICWHPDLYRVHLASALPRSAGPLGGFALSVRQSLDGSDLEDASQVGFDRILRLAFRKGDKTQTLVLELMGKHTNVVLIGPDGNVTTAAKQLGPSKSVRPVLPGKSYASPPSSFRRKPWEAETYEELRKAEGASPYLLASVGAEGETEGTLSADSRKRLVQIREAVASGSFRPYESETSGVYPLPLGKLAETGKPAESLSLSLERHYALLAGSLEVHRLRSTLEGQLKRVETARRRAITSLEVALEHGDRAVQDQLCGELILAYQHQIVAGDSSFETQDYEGNRVSMPLDPDLGAVENAQKYFRRAKKSRLKGPEMAVRLAKLQADLAVIDETLNAVRAATEASSLAKLEAEARRRGWLHTASIQEKEDRPFQGYKIREVLAPSGHKVLFGENATSNDYLTTKVAKPNDWWLHVRGAPSAHVVVRTDNQPDRVPRTTLEFAAVLAAKQSAAKHSSLVAVDYTLKKYVRKPRGAAPGSVLIERERTLHVSP